MAPVSPARLIARLAAGLAIPIVYLKRCLAPLCSGYGAGRDRKYKVQFWNDEIGLAIEIIGGVIYSDKKNKVLRVEFSADYDECVDLFTKEHIAWVTFTLERSPL